MTAPRITAEEIEYLRGFVAIPRAMSRETIRTLDDVLDALDSAYAELDRLHADGMPRDREELQKLLNDAHRKGNQEAHEAHRLTQEMGLSAQGGEVPELDNGANPYQRNTENPGSLGWYLSRAYREGYDCARKLSRPAPPHPDTVEDELEILRKIAALWLPPFGVPPTYESRALFSLLDALRAQAQPTTNETRG